MRTDINYKGVFGDVTCRDVVITAQHENDFIVGCGRLELNTQFESVHLTLASVQNVISVPSSFSVNEAQVVGDLLSTLQDAFTVLASQGVTADDKHRKFG
jgi:hypothetical protein